MERDDHRSSTTAKIELPDFPGEQVLAHEGNAWIIAATVRLAPHELIVVAETGVPPAARAIVDTDLSDYPELPSSHPQYERRKSERKRFITQNEANVEQRALRAWTTQNPTPRTLPMMCDSTAMQAVRSA